MSINQDLAVAVANNDVPAAAHALRRGAKLPRPTMKHPVFEWLARLDKSQEQSLPMLQLLVENGLSPEFRVAAHADRLPRSAFSATISSRVAGQYGDKGDSLLGRLVFRNQFASAKWLVSRVDPEMLIKTHQSAPHGLHSPIERALIAGQWDLVSDMLDRIASYPIEEDDGAYWEPIHNRALKFQLSYRAPDPQCQSQLDRIFQMGASRIKKLPFLPEYGPHKVPASSLEKWIRALPGAVGFFMNEGHRRQKDAWEMLFSSPSSYESRGALMHRLVSSPGFEAVSSRAYPLDTPRSSKSERMGTLCDIAMVGTGDDIAPTGREMVIDILLAAGCRPSLPPGTMFKQVIVAGRTLGSHLPRHAWEKYPGHLPADALAFCRRASQFSELVSWGCNPSAPSANGTPALVELLRAMRTRQSSTNLRDLALAVAGLLEQRPELLRLSCPVTGESVADLSFQRTNISKRASRLPGSTLITPWALVSCCLGGSKLNEEAIRWIKENKGKDISLPGVGVSPWFYCVLHQARVSHRRTAVQHNDSSAAMARLRSLGAWPQSSAMEGFRRLCEAFGQEEKAATRREWDSTATGYFAPGSLASSVRSVDDLHFMARAACLNGPELVRLVHGEIRHMDAASRTELFCAWVSAARDHIIESTQDLMDRPQLRSIFPHATVMDLLERLSSDSSTDARRITASAIMVMKLENDQGNPDKKFLDDVQRHVDYLSMRSDTAPSHASRQPTRRL